MAKIMSENLRSALQHHSDTSESSHLEAKMNSQALNTFDEENTLQEEDTTQNGTDDVQNETEQSDTDRTQEGTRRNYDTTKYSTQSSYTGVPFVGLVNQGTTCYLNSLIQALYLTPEFRDMVWNWKTDQLVPKSLPYELQRLFILMRKSTQLALETRDLTLSFGWDSSYSSQQHDVQELWRIMFDALEKCFQNKPETEMIKDLYEGEMVDYVKCLKCNTMKKRPDKFQDVPLTLKPFCSEVPYETIEKAIEGFIEPERLDGSNQYFCSNCNEKCDANKGLAFTKLPYILTIQLKRFDYDFRTMQRIKLDHKLTFPEYLNMQDYLLLQEDIIQANEAVHEKDDNNKVEHTDKEANKEIVTLENNLDEQENIINGFNEVINETQNKTSEEIQKTTSNETEAEEVKTDSSERIEAQIEHINDQKENTESTNAIDIKVVNKNETDEKDNAEKQLKEKSVSPPKKIKKVKLKVKTEKDSESKENGVEKKVKIVKKSSKAQNIPALGELSEEKKINGTENELNSAETTIGEKPLVKRTVKIVKKVQGETEDKKKIRSSTEKELQPSVSSNGETVIKKTVKIVKKPVQNIKSDGKENDAGKVKKMAEMFKSKDNESTDDKSLTNGCVTNPVKVKKVIKKVKKVVTEDSDLKKNDEENKIGDNDKKETVVIEKPKVKKVLSDKSISKTVKTVKVTDGNGNPECNDVEITVNCKLKKPSKDGESLKPSKKQDDISNESVNPDIKENETLKIPKTKKITRNKSKSPEKVADVCKENGFKENKCIEINAENNENFLDENKCNLKPNGTENGNGNTERKGDITLEEHDGISTKKNIIEPITIPPKEKGIKHLESNNTIQKQSIEKSPEKEKEISLKENPIEINDIAEPVKNGESVQEIKDEIKSQAEDENIYELFAVLMHTGSAKGGHYFAYIKSLESKKWYCFNDRSVTQVDSSQIVSAFGGSKISGSTTRSTNAYMLKYRKLDPVRNVNLVENCSIPEKLNATAEKYVPNERDSTYSSKSRNMMRTRIWYRPLRDDNVDNSITTAVDEKLPLKMVRVYTFANSSIKDLTAEALERLELEIPRETCRLVKFDESLKTIEYSFENEDLSLGELFEENCLHTFLLEIKPPGTQFITYDINRLSTPVYKVDISKKQITDYKLLTLSKEDTLETFKKAIAFEFMLEEPLDVMLDLPHQIPVLLAGNDTALKDLECSNLARYFVTNQIDYNSTHFMLSDFYKFVSKLKNTVQILVQLPPITEPLKAEEKEANEEDKRNVILTEPDGLTFTCTDPLVFKKNVPRNVYFFIDTNLTYQEMRTLLAPLCNVKVPTDIKISTYNPCASTQYNEILSYKQTLDESLCFALGTSQYFTTLELEVKVTEVMGENDIKGKIYLLELDKESYSGLIDLVVDRKLKVGDVKRLAVSKFKELYGVQLQFDLYRLRRKNDRYISDVLSDKDIFENVIKGNTTSFSLCIQQVSPGQRLFSNTVDGVFVFYKRYYPSEPAMDLAKEIFLPDGSDIDFVTQVLDATMIAMENIEISLAPTKFPCENNFFKLNRGGHWTAPTANKEIEWWSTNILGDGHVIYVRDKTESVAHQNSTDQNNNGGTQSGYQRSYSHTVEKPLKIFVDKPAIRTSPETEVISSNGKVDEADAQNVD